MDLTGSINLLALGKEQTEATSKAFVATLHGVECVIIPTIANDIYVRRDDSGAISAAYLQLNVSEKREADQYGKTHYAKQSFSKFFRENHADMVEAKKSIYLGDFKPFQYSQPTAPEIQQGWVSQQEDDQLPF